MHTEFFLVGVNAQCDKGDRGTLLGIAQVAGWSCCSESASRCWSFHFNWTPPFTHIQLAIGIIKSDLHKIQLAVELQNVPTAKLGGLHCSTWHTKATNNQTLKLTVNNASKKLEASHSYWLCCLQAQRNQFQTTLMVDVVSWQSSDTN